MHILLFEGLEMYKFCFFVPETHLDQVKTAVFAAGAGKICNYDSCAWQVKGIGQFRPLTGNNAFIGQTDLLEEVSEYRVEMVCPKTKMPEIVRALKDSHPYEAPAYDVTEVLDF